MDSGKKYLTVYFSLSIINGKYAKTLLFVLNIAVENTGFCLLKLQCPQKYFTHKNYGNGHRDIESAFKK